MINKGTYVCFAIALFMLLITKPVLPVCSGLILLAIVISRANGEMSSVSAKRRWAGFKRMAAMTAFGMVLVYAGFHLGSAPWSVKIITPATARGAMFSLAVYCASLIITPGIIWSYMNAIKQDQRLPRRVKRADTTLSGLAGNTHNRRIKLAV